jgi:hypothetical protein
MNFNIRKLFKYYSVYIFLYQLNYILKSFVDSFANALYQLNVLYDIIHNVRADIFYVGDDINFRIMSYTAKNLMLILFASANKNKTNTIQLKFFMNIHFTSLAHSLIIILFVEYWVKVFEHLFTVSVN